MKMTGEMEIIQKAGNLLDPSTRISLQHKVAYHHQLKDDRDVDTEGGASNSNDNNNNDYNGDENGPYTCPICHADNFSSQKSLDEHVKCDHALLYKQYSEMMESLNSLAIRSMMQASDKSAIPNSKINFKLFHYLENKNSLYDKIAENIGSSPSYRCNFCGEHFTGSQFMYHWKQCTQFRPDDSSEGYAEDLVEDYYDGEETKSHFLAGLSLPRTRDESNHSIESDSAIKSIQKATSSLSQPTYFADDENNTDDDPFKSEVRDMKRRGEFPCRICHKIFRNLRALKGHARIHITNNRGVRPYECNICSFSTNDKSIIIRHIRSHNGDHPYKCQLCFSTFTTKANCERHLRNAHHKTSREDIKKLLVDLSNKPSHGGNGSSSSGGSVSTSVSTKFKTKLQSLLTSDEKDVESSLIKAAHFYNHALIKTEIEETAALKPRAQCVDDSSNSNDSNNNTSSSVTSFNKKFDDYSISFNVPPLIDMRMANVGKRFYETTPLPLYQPREKPIFMLPKPESDTEEPLDLSVDVLDLSRKKKDLENESGVENLSIKSREYQSPSSSLSSSPLPPATRPPPAALPLFPKAEISPRGFPPATNQMVSNLSSLFVSNAFSAAKMCTNEETLQGVKMQPLIFSHLVANAAEQYEESFRHKTTTEDVKFKEVQKPRASSKSSTVKMVMKDGVLVEKQKQRRYRTEKPFSCAYCNGRFTLRSNMDRHVKQQHPGFWRQRQRGGSTRVRRKSKDESMTESVTSDHLKVNEGSGNDVMALSTGKRPIESDVEDDLHQPDKMVKKDDDRSDVDGEDEHSVATDANTSESVNNADIDEDYDDEELVIDEGQSEPRDLDESTEPMDTVIKNEKPSAKEENPDLASVRSLLDNVSTQTFSQYFGSEEEAGNKHDDGSEDDEEGLVAGSSSEGNGSGGEEKSATDTDGRTSAQQADGTKKKKSAYSTAPNRVHCDFCYRSFPWASSLRRHTLTHTGQKPYKCSSCPLLFTTKSNCDRHFLRKHRNEVGRSQATSVTLPVPANSAIDADSVISSSSSNASVSPATNNATTTNCNSRNVPERPFKCSNCPSSTFSSFLNLKKHLIEKHNHKDTDEECSNATTSNESCNQKCQQDEVSAKDSIVATNNNSGTSNSKTTDDKECKSQYEQNYSAHAASDLPFKCHLCYRSFGERQEALDHMSTTHPAEFQQLIGKGALDMNAKSEDVIGQDEAAQANAVHSDENNIDQGRAHFPDYSSRKVICAFCMRRFWSAEDLRRHMRTHTGERPFACDICHRRFTLKHSMLRHRKKHSNKLFTSSASEENSPNSDDEEPSSPLNNGLTRDHGVLPLMVDNAKSDAVDYTHCEEDNIVNKGPVKGCNKSAKEDGVDLIAKLLDIDDKQLVDAMLTSKSADDVAKLLGVQK